MTPIQQIAADLRDLGIERTPAQVDAAIDTAIDRMIDDWRLDAEMPEPAWMCEEDED